MPYCHFTVVSLTVVSDFGHNGYCYRAQKTTVSTGHVSTIENTGWKLTSVSLLLQWAQWPLLNSATSKRCLKPSISNKPWKERHSKGLSASSVALNGGLTVPQTRCTDRAVVGTTEQSSNKTYLFWPLLLQCQCLSESRANSQSRSVFSDPLYLGMRQQLEPELLKTPLMTWCWFSLSWQ